MINYMFGILAVETVIIVIAFIGGYCIGKAKRINELEHIIERYYDDDICRHDCEHCLWVTCPLDEQEGDSDANSD